MGKWIRRRKGSKAVGSRKKIKKGDIVILKSSFTKGPKHNISVTGVRAVGIVESDINVVSNKKYVECSCAVRYISTESKDFEGFANMKTIHLLDDAKGRTFIDYVNELSSPKSQYQKYIDLLKETHNLVLTGAPGTGKTFMAQKIAEQMGCTKDEMGFVQFHPSYDYTDFVEGLRPFEKEDGRIGFERKDGIFKEFCKRAIKNLIDSEKTNVESVNKIDRKPFVFIIDEINRGEASKIFGELFYAIDPGYRGKKDVCVKTQYQNLIPESDTFADGFFVPENVYILATMNDIDRSVESMDFAMRRRFTWKEVAPADTQSMLDSLDCANKAKGVMTELNSVITDTDGLGEAYQIGPSYFLKLGENGGDFTKLWEMNIKPLLQEYLRGFRKADEIMKKCYNAYFGVKDNEIETGETEMDNED